MPFAGYKNFQDCVEKCGKDNPENYCGYLYNRIEKKNPKAGSTPVEAPAQKNGK